VNTNQKISDRSPHAVIIGDINIDIITPPVGPTLPENETSFLLDEFFMSLGGNAINMAAALAAMGSKHTFLGGMGDCAMSDWIRKKCNELKINTRLHTFPGKTAGITFALTYTGGRRQFIATIGTNRDAKISDLDLSSLDQATHLHRAGFWYTPNMQGQGTIDIMKKMIDAGQETSLDVGWDPLNFPPDHQELLYKTLAYTTYFFANEKEVKAITKKSNVDAACHELLGISTKIDNPVIVLHQGEKGCTVVTKREHIHIPPYHVENVVNPTGSGDVYNGGFVHGLLNGWSLEKCAKWAAKAAAVHLGDFAKIYPTIQDIGNIN
jgi:sugar/nucleoside kinase (ribokinase family)